MIVVESGVEVGAAVVLLQPLLSDNSSPDLSSVSRISRHDRVDVRKRQTVNRVPAAMRLADQTYYEVGRVNPCMGEVAQIHERVDRPRNTQCFRVRRNVRLHTTSEDCLVMVGLLGPRRRKLLVPYVVNAQ